MAEYKKWDLTTIWRKDKVKDFKCRICGTPTSELAEAWVCNISWRRNCYSVLCVPCYDKRQAKKLGDVKDDRSDPYQISDIARACKALKMKIMVEEPGSGLAKQLAEMQKRVNESTDIATDYSRHSGHNMIADLIHNFPLGLSLLAANKLKGGGKDPGRHDKHRRELFIALAKRLRPFLPKVSGIGLDRLYMKNRGALARKHAERVSFRDWLRVMARKPERLFPLTKNQEASAKLLMELLPRKSAVTAHRYDTEGGKEAMKRLGIEESDRLYAHDVEVEVYNTPKGPRFIIRHNKEGK